jgi:hypothetical protein
MPALPTYADDNIVHGYGPVRPIVNIPAGVLKVRVRQRCNEITRVFLRFADRIEQWDIEAFPGTKPRWALTFCVASNAVLTQSLNR